MPDFDFSKYATPDRQPTAGERKATADVRKTEGEAEKLYATLPASKEEADAKAKEAQYRAAQLGWETANADFQKEYVRWRSGDAANTIANLKLLIDAVRVLETNKTLTGPIISRLPKIVREYYIPGGEDLRNDVQKAIQASLRETLGAQFTAEEGERINNNTFNPGIPASMVAANVRGELNKVLDLAVSREAMARYYEANNTLKGYKAEDWKPAIEAEFRAMEGVSEADQRAAAAANYRDSVNNIGGEPLKGFRFRPGEERQIIDYANSAEFTPEGYINLVASLYENAAGVAPDMDDLRAEAEKIAERPVGDRVGSGMDYSKVDLAAMQAAGIDEKFIQMLKNAPTSAVVLVSDLLSPVSDAVKSVMLGERTGVYKSIPDLVADVAAKAGLGETDQETLNALSDVLEERYGGMDEIERTLVSDPIGLVADLSMVLTAGGTAAARAPGAVGKTGRVAARAGQAIDPISFAGNVLSKATPEDLANFARRAPAESVALTTGAPPSAFRQAYDIGAERQRLGVTPRSEAFREGLAGKVDPSDLVADAKRAMQEVRDAASQEYRSGMMDVATDKSILSFDDIDIALQKMRSDAMFNGQVVDSAALAAVERMQPVVDQWRALDPASFHTPEGMDKLKQRIFDEVGNIPDDQRTVRRAAGTVYNAVKDTINQQAPTYAKVMEQYADASEVLGRMERELGLGRKGSIDTAAAKLTERPPSRKGRDDLVSLLAEYDPVVGAEIAGEQLSRYFPRGLRGAGTGLGVAGGSAAGAFTNPLALLGATTISPHLMGEAAYGLGRASVPVGDAFSAVGRSPGTRLGAQRGLAIAGQTDEELERQALVDRYMFSVPPAGDQMPAEPATEQRPTAMPLAVGTDDNWADVTAAGEAVTPPAQTTRVINGRVTDIDPVTQQRVYVDTGEPVENTAMKLGGMVRKYQEGGAVKGRQPWAPKSDQEINRNVTTMIKQGRTADDIQRYLNSIEPGLGDRAENLEANIAYHQDTGLEPRASIKFTSPLEDATLAMSRRGSDVLGAGADIIDLVSRYLPSGMRTNLRERLDRGWSDVEGDFYLRGATGASTPDMPRMPVRMGDVAYRPQDVAGGVVTQAPRAGMAAGRYLARSTPASLMRDAGRAAEAGWEMVKEDPYGLALDSALYVHPATAMPTAAADTAMMRGMSRDLAQEYGATADPEIRAEITQDREMMDALAVLPVLGAPGTGRYASALTRKIAKPVRRKRGGSTSKKSAKAALKVK
jgi:hypothetical protein